MSPQVLRVDFALTTNRPSPRCTHQCPSSTSELVPQGRIKFFDLNQFTERQILVDSNAAAASTFQIFHWPRRKPLCSTIRISESGQVEPNFRWQWEHSVYPVTDFLALKATLNRIFTVKTFSLKYANNYPWIELKCVATSYIGHCLKCLHIALDRFHLYSGRLYINRMRDWGDTLLKEDTNTSNAQSNIDLYTKRQLQLLLSINFFQWSTRSDF